MWRALAIILLGYILVAVFVSKNWGDLTMME